MKHKNFEKITNYSTIKFTQDKENKETQLKSRFYILFRINILENSKINKKTRETVLLELIIYLLNSQISSKHKITVVYELIKNYSLDIELTIKRILSCSEIENEIDNLCFMLAELLYYLSLNINIEKEKSNNFYENAIFY